MNALILEIVKTCIRGGDNMDNSVQKLTEWLESQKTQTILIIKEELATGKIQAFDKDRVQMLLNKVDVHEIERHDEDDYLSDKELILHGEGYIHSDKGEVELPQAVYEIPLSGEIIAYTENHEMKVETEKANYTMIVL